MAKPWHSLSSSSAGRFLNLTKKNPNIKRIHDNYPELRELHSQGLNDRQIAKIMGFARETVGAHLKKLSLVTNGARKEPIQLVSDTHAQCSKCPEIKPIEEFQLMRRQQKYEYRISYCNTCRKKQANNNLRSSIDKFVGDRVNRLKRRCLQNGTPINIDKFYVLNQLKKQNGLCFYSNQSIDWQTVDKLRGNCLSIDKIIPSLGYIEGNVVLVINRVNSVKYDCTLEEIRSWMPFWYNRIMRHFNESGVTYDGNCLIFPNGTKHPHKKLKRHTK